MLSEARATHLHAAFFKAPKTCFKQPKAHKKEELFTGQLIARSYGKNKFLKLSWSREGYVSFLGKGKAPGGIKAQTSAFHQGGMAAAAGSHPVFTLWGLK